MLTPEVQESAAVESQTQETESEAAPSTSEQVVTKGGKVLPMAQTTIDKIKREAIERGKRGAALEWENKAKALGYDSVDEMLKAAERAKKQAAKPKQKPKPQQQQQAQQQNNNGNNDRRPNDRRDREVQERLDRERRQRIAAQHRAEQAERDQWAAEANGQLARIAIRSGCKDEEYAITLMNRDLERKQATMSPVEYEKYLKEFDEVKYFDGLKKTHPHLYVETIVPATTGTVQTNDAPPPPGAGAVVQRAANGAQKNARNMSKDEYREELRRRGLQPPGVS